MNPRRLGIFALVTLVVIVGAIFAAKHRAPQTTQQKAVFLPGLRDHVNDVAIVQLEGKGHTLTLERRDGAHWTLKQADGYAVPLDHVRKVIVGAAELRALDPKTSNPELYSRLGVEDPAAHGANSVLLTFEDAAGKSLAALIVGQTRKSSAPGDQPGLYVRHAGEAQAWLVEGQIDLSMEASHWFDRDLFSIPDERVRDITISRGGQVDVHLQRAHRHDDITLMNLPDGKSMPSAVVLSPLGTELEDVFADNVRKSDNVRFTDAAAHTTVRTFDGLVAEITAEKIGDELLAAFAFSYDAAGVVPEDKPEKMTGDGKDAAAADAPVAAPADAQKPADVEKEAHDLNAKVSGWVYVIPRFKFDLFTKSMDTLLRTVPKPGDAPPPG